MIIRNLIFVLIALALGFVGTLSLIKNRPQAKKTKRIEAVVLVEVRSFDFDESMAQVN